MHPMNLTCDLTYHGGGTIEFGPNLGGAAVQTLSRRRCAAECSNVAASRGCLR
jgi:glycine betaine/proline transport system substrate-binding protein